MGLLRKRSSGVDIIDYTLLQKRGILKKIKEEKYSEKNEKKADNLEVSSSNKPAQIYPSLADSSPLEFLDSLANTGNNNISYLQENSSNPSQEADALPKNIVNEISTLKLKIEDLEYKIERLSEKLNNIKTP